MLRSLTPNRFSIVALLAGFGFSSLLGGSALAGPDVWESYNTTRPAVSLADCIAKAPLALRAMGMTVTSRRDFANNENIWIGHSAKTTTMIICYPLGSGKSAQFIFAAANEGAGVPLGEFQTQLLEQFYGTGSISGCTSPAGTWNWWNGGTATFTADGLATLSGGHTGKWVRLPDGTYTVHWDFPSDDYFTLSADGKSMLGNMKGHTGFNGQAGTSTRTSPC